MNIFSRILERLGVQRGEDRGMSVLCDSRDDLDEILAQARMTARALQTEIKFAPPGERLNVITTGDFDSKGKLKDSARKRIEELAKAKKQ
jgi:hypothetical protein